MLYLWLKSFHVFFMVCWFAGLFYLPRLFVNLAMLAEDNSDERGRLLLMSGKLYRFITPIGALTLITGIALLYAFDISGGWLHAKITLVVLLIIYHFYCGKLLHTFKKGRNSHSHYWYRVYNELPVVLLLAIIILAIVKPF